MPAGGHAGIRRIGGNAEVGSGALPPVTEEARERRLGHPYDS
jgi:hypothetical protein